MDTETSARVIPARSERQVMDWSLVLASQNIGATILRADSTWGLAVQEQDYQSALHAIQQYRLENRHWHWRQPIPWSEALFEWGALGWCILLMVVHWASTERIFHLRSLAEFATVKFAAGEWWRAFTAVWLHADLGHLLANTTIGFLLLGLAMARYGAGLALCATFLAGAAGNLAGYVLYSHHYTGVGASGMVMGALGLICVPRLRQVDFHLRGRRHFVQAVFAGLALFLLLGVDPRSDVIAHAGGFIAGVLLGVLLNLMPQGGGWGQWLNAAGWGGFASLFIVTAWMVARSL